jgi:hypothetical protein
MENKIPIPTDNIFKFYALFGLLLCIFSINRESIKECGCLSGDGLRQRPEHRSVNQSKEASNCLFVFFHHDEV